MRSFVFWALLPFLLPQALRVRRNAPRVAAAAGPTQGVAGDGRPLSLVAVGDSIIAGVGVKKLSDALVGRAAIELAETLSCQIVWQAIGRIGARSDTVHRSLLARLPQEPADFFVVSIGVNDVTALARVSTFRRNLGRLFEALERHSPAAITAIAGIPPLRGFPLLPQPLRALFGLRGDTFDGAIRKLAAKRASVAFVPLDFDPLPEKFSADGFHPSEESYREFGRMVAQPLAHALRDRLDRDAAAG